MSAAISSILVPTDFSETASHAVDLGRQLAGKIDGRMTLLHAVDPLVFRHYAPELTVGGAGDDQAAALREEGGRELNRLIESCRADGLEAEGLLVEGGATEQILRVAAEDGHDLIVIGTHGYGPVRRLLLGSVAIKVVRNAPCSVISIPPPADRPVHELKTLLLATDFSPPSMAARDHAAQLARAFGAKVIVQHVMDLPPSYYGAIHRIPQLIDQDALHKELETKLLTLADELGDQGIKVERKLDEGRPADQILEAADSVGADLILVGATGRSAIERVLLGGVADAIVRGASCPVMTCRS